MRELIDRLLLERISLCGIARVAQVSETWLQQYVNEKYALVQREVEVTPFWVNLAPSSRRIILTNN